MSSGVMVASEAKACSGEIPMAAMAMAVVQVRILSTQPNQLFLKLEI